MYSRCIGEGCSELQTKVWPQRLRGPLYCCPRGGRFHTGFPGNCSWDVVSVVLSQPEQSLHSAMQCKINQTGPLWQWEEKEQGTSSFSSSPWAFEEGNGWGYETMKMPLSFGSQIPMYSPPLGATYRGWKDRIYKSCVPSYHTYEVASVWLRLCYPTTLEACTQNIVLRLKPQFAVNNDRRIYVEWDIHFVVIHTTVLKSKGLNWVG